jgi:hypothetical protein
MRSKQPKWRLGSDPYPRSINGHQVFQLNGIGGRGALLVFVEIDEYVAALLVPVLDAVGPTRGHVLAIMPFVVPLWPMPPVG